MPVLLQINATANWGSTGRIVEATGLAAKSHGWDSYVAYGRYSCPSSLGLIKVGGFLNPYLHYLESRHFINSKQALLKELTGKDHAVLEAALSMEGDYDFDKHFELLFTWCKETMERV